MTNREFFTAIATNENLAVELRDFANLAIDKLDRRNENRTSKPSKTAIANEPIKQAIVDYVTANANAVASDIATALGLTTQKASALCRQLVDNGVLTTNEVKIPKKGKVKAYRLATTDEVAGE